MTSRAAATSRWTDRILSLNGWLVFAFLYLPIFMVVVFSVSASENVGIWGGFSLRWYERMFANEQLMNSLKNSVIIAIISTTVATVLGTAAALSLNRYRRWIGRGAFDGLLYLPIIIPDVAMAVMLLMWFTSTDLIPFGLWSISLAHIAFNISFVAIIVRARLANMDPAMEDAASDLYAGRWKTFSKVTLPLILPGVLGGALLALTLSLDDVVITSFVQGPGATTLPVYVFGLIRKSITPEINAVSTLMITISMVLVLGSLGLQQRAERRN